MPIPVIIFIIFIICVILRYIFWPDLGEVKTENTVRNNFKRVEEDDGAIILVNAGTVFQFMESLKIIETTIDIETLKGRIDFSTRLYYRLLSAFNDDAGSYTLAYNDAVKMYQTAYSTSNISFDCRNLLSVPFVELNKYFCENIFRCFDGYTTKMSLELVTLKTKPAKKRRMEKVTELFNTCNEMIKSRNGIELLDKLETQYRVFTLLYEHLLNKKDTNAI